MSYEGVRSSLQVVLSVWAAGEIYLLYWMLERCCAWHQISSPILLHWHLLCRCGYSSLAPACRVASHVRFLGLCLTWLFFFFPSLQRKKVWNFSKIRKPQKQLPYKYFNCLHQLQARLECQPLGLIITNPTIPSGCCKVPQEHQYSSGKIVKFSEICQDERKYMNG